MGSWQPQPGLAWVWRDGHPVPMPCPLSLCIPRPTLGAAELGFLGSLGSPEQGLTARLFCLCSHQRTFVLEVMGRHCG